MGARNKFLTFITLPFLSGLLFSLPAGAQVSGTCAFMQHNDLQCLNSSGDPLDASSDSGTTISTDPSTGGVQLSLPDGTPIYISGLPAGLEDGLSSTTVLNFVSSVPPVEIGGGMCMVFGSQMTAGNMSFTLGGAIVAPCSEINNAGGSYSVNPASVSPTGEWCGGITPPGSTPGERIANAAVSSIGTSTANIPGTEGGSLGCAAAVTNILECAGYGVGITLGTGDLYGRLNADSCYELVDSGSISDAALQPGDVLVTMRGDRAGHTGIYIGNGQIVSNSSGGFQGSAPGTVQQNYSVSSWESVTNRNPGGSGVFRYRC